MVHLSWHSVDAIVVAILCPLVAWIVFSGVDDLIVDVVGLVTALRGTTEKNRPSRPQLLARVQKPIAILVPLWQEAGVIARMVQRNSESILYRNYHIFIGGYPNDAPTLEEIRKLEARYPHVHLAVCPHNGPTSKADCLNWIFQNVVAHENNNVIRFEIIVIHDAEDVIHSDSLHWINYYSDDYEMIQVPVLPLPTPLTKITHGIYIDEFTEYQTRDMPVRQAMGAFVPSNGVGTGFCRNALDALATSANNLIFEPVCLTEDYENGLRLRLRGARQLFLPLQCHVATRELFPLTFSAAIRQRTRWVTGIALQTWDRHGWSGALVQKYWLWRDRKGLIGNPASLLTNVLFLYGSVRWFCCGTLIKTALIEFATFLGMYRIVYRMICVGRVFGIPLALMTPMRVLVANVINTSATVSALWRFSKSKLRAEPLVWIKTQHSYPCQAALARPSNRLGELLVANGYLTQAEVDRALETKPAHRRIGEHLVACGQLSEESLYEALSLQQSLPQIRIEPKNVKRTVAQSLPAKVAAKHKLIPFKVDLGRLLIAGPELPTPELREELGRFTSLEIEFRLMTPGNYRELASALLPA